jgi:hypothetical protein
MCFGTEWTFRASFITDRGHGSKNMITAKEFQCILCYVYSTLGFQNAT